MILSIIYVVYVYYLSNFMYFRVYISRESVSFLEKIYMKSIIYNTLKLHILM